MFDTEIDSIRFFDKDTQRSLENIDEIIIRPTKELIYDKNDYKKVIELIKKDIENISDSGNSTKLKDKYNQIISYLSDSLYIANEDLITPYRNENFDDFFDYLDKDSIFLFQDLNRSIDNFLQDMEKSDLDFTNQLENGEIFPSFKNIKIDINKIFTNIKSYPIINS